MHTVPLAKSWSQYHAYRYFKETLYATMTVGFTIIIYDHYLSSYINLHSLLPMILLSLNKTDILIDFHRRVN